MLGVTIKRNATPIHDILKVHNGLHCMDKCQWEVTKAKVETPILDILRVHNGLHCMDTCQWEK